MEPLENGSIGSFEMGGQGIERREMLRYIAIASVAGTFPGFCQWAFACSHNPPTGSLAQVVAQPYKTLFFSPKNYQMVEHLADMIIPSDDTPGAKQAGVAEFIDFMVANRAAISGRDELPSTEAVLALGEQVQGHFLVGLDWLNAHTKAQFGHEFVGCTSQQQTGLLEELAYKAKFKPGTETGRDFFQLMRDYTVVGYYTTKIGLESLGYPGLRTVWPKMPGCAHPNDPEHAHLQEPGDANLGALRSQTKGSFP
jgi:gluconate 2-dehydrogenase gamma chain